MRAFDRRAARHLLGLAALIAFPGAVRAQIGGTPAGRDCNPLVVWQDSSGAHYGPTWAPHHPGQLLAEVDPLLARGSYAEAFDRLERRLLAWPKPLSGATLVAMRAHLDSARREFDAVERSPDRARLAARAEGVVAVRFQYTQPEYGLFEGRGGGLDARAIADSGQRRAVCWTALAAHEVLQTYVGASRRAIAARLDTLRRRWDAYRDARYSLYPWELALNGIGRGRSLEPPQRQLLIVHPAVGVEVGGISLDSLRQSEISADNAVVVEWLGYIKYVDNWQSFRGASVVSSLTGAGGWDLGLLVHFSPRLRVGATYQRVSVDGSASAIPAARARHTRYSLITSLDLYKHAMRFTSPRN
jgi:hypothetical protein